MSSMYIGLVKNLGIGFRFHRAGFDEQKNFYGKNFQGKCELVYQNIKQFVANKSFFYFIRKY